MIPIALNPEHVTVMLVGGGPVSLRRGEQLLSLGLKRFLVFAERPEPNFKASLGRYLTERLPTGQEIAGAAVMYIADVEGRVAEDLARTARAVGTLVNVEDVKPLCDFHSLSQVRRGDLTVAISTAGKSPGLSVRLRKYLEQRMGPEWGDRLEELNAVREQWRGQGKTLPEVARLTDRYIDEKGWLPWPKAS